MSLGQVVYRGQNQRIDNCLDRHVKRLRDLTDLPCSTMSMKRGQELEQQLDSYPAVHEPEAEYVTRNRKKKRPHKKENRQRRRV